ncbi:MAG: ABC transporter permease [Clostridia bacterium]|nr:ABC transporter permease [Clostridia bacterium]
MTRMHKARPLSMLMINAWRWGILLALILLWEAGSRMGLIDPFFFSSPRQIWDTAVIKWQSGQLWRDIAYTASSTILGFLLGTSIGSILGLLLWFSRRTALVAEPWMIVLNALPKLALAPVLVIWFGIGFSSKVVLAFLMTVIVSIMSAYSGVQTVDPALSTLMISLGAKRRQIFTRLVVPSAMPSIITGLRVNIALAMAGSIVGEFIASDRGLGRMIVYAGTTFDLKLVWVGVVVLSIVSVLMYAGVVLLERLLMHRWSARKPE